jgi:hypothetical protein
MAVHSDEIHNLYEQTKALADRLRNSGEYPSRREWEAIGSLENALYDLWGAFGALALQELGR